MRRVRKNGLTFYQFETMARFGTACHGFFSRAGGVSDRPHDSLNVSLGIGDTGRNVAENRRRISRCFPRQELIFSSQVHEAGVLVCNPGGFGPSNTFGETPEGDAMITNVPGLALVIQVADCQAVILYDTVGNAIANIHSGWRGSIRNIIGKTVNEMTRRYGTQPADIVAGIAPSLGPCCAEFVNYRKEIPRSFWKYMDARHHFDFWAISIDQLCQAGVRPDRIEVSGMCTRCRTDLFFSYRGENVTGRLAAVIGLNPKQEG